jgi:hypothetical protein
MLRVETSGPRSAWIVVCTAGCRCLGPDCPCGMPTRAEDAGHAWALTSIWSPADRARIAAWVAEQAAAARTAAEREAAAYEAMASRGRRRRAA